MGNAFIFEDRLIFNAITSQEDTTQVDQDDTITDPFPYQGSFKSPGKALLFSGALPGMGQFYMKKWMRGLLFATLDGIAIGTWYINNNVAEDKKKEYSNYAYQKWDLSRWIHDYYKWYPPIAPDDFSGGQEKWDLIREVFVNRSDTLGGCDEPPYCYTDIWDHSHNVEFYYNGKPMKSSSNDFKVVFQDLCDNSYLGDPKCSIDLENMNMKDDNNDTILVTTSHHFYEGIQKYDMFFAGWEDNESVIVVSQSHGDINATSPYQQAYRSLWNDYNRIMTLAGNGSKFMLINRVVSMLDAIILAKNWNNQHGVKLSLSTYPDLRNKTGLGRVKLTVYFK